MKTQDAAPAPHHNRRLTAASAVAAALLAAAFAACSSPAASALPSIAVPSIDASAAASLGAQAALTALDEVDSAIAANESSGGLTADDATSLKSISASIRTALQTGDMSAAQPAVDEFSTKVDELASGLSGDAGQQLQDAVAALKAALAGS